MSIHCSFKRELHRMSADFVDRAEEAVIECLKCPYCQEYMQPPCACCEEGHFMCTPCKIKLQKCPTCGSSSFPNRVNVVFDKILEAIYYPCINEDDGCPVLVKYSEREVHEQSCCYQRVSCRYSEEGCIVTCPKKDKEAHEKICKFGVPCRLHVHANGREMLRCNWRGSLNEVFDHIMAHPEQKWVPPESLETNVTFTWMLVMNMNVTKTEFIRLRDVGEMFYFHIKCESEGAQRVAIQHIGNEKVGANYRYAVEFKYGSKIIVFRDKVIPSSEEDVFNHRSCCNFHYKFLKLHFEAERVCDCYIRIFRKGQENSKGKRILSFLGSKVTEEKDGIVNNRESFQEVIEVFLESMDLPESLA